MAPEVVSELVSEVLPEEVMAMDYSRERSPAPLLAALAVVAMFAWGVAFYGLGFYMLRLNDLRGWSLSALSTMALLFYLASAALSFWVASLLARRGARFVFTLGALSTGAALLTLPHVTRLWLLAVVYLVLAVGWTATNSVPISTTVMAWFTNGQRELSIALIGASFGGILIIPVLGILDDRYGFATAMTIVGTTEIIVVGALARLVIDTPVSDAPVIDAPVSEGAATEQGYQVDRVDRAGRAAWSIARQPRFWILAPGLALTIIVQGGFLVHQLTLIATVTTDATAARVVGIATAAALIGRMGPIVVGDRVAPAIVGAGYLTVQAAGLLWLAAVDHSTITVTIGSVLFGLGVGVVVTMPSLLTRTTYPDLPYTSAYPVVNLSFQLSLATGAPLVALGHNIFDGYRPTMWILGPADLIAAALFIALHRVTRRTVSPTSLAPSQ